MKFTNHLDIENYIKSLTINEIMNLTLYVTGSVRNDFLIYNNMTIGYPTDGRLSYNMYFTDIGNDVYQLRFDLINPYINIIKNYFFFDQVKSEYTNTIVNQYGFSRHYHNWEHIKYMFNVAYIKNIQLSTAQILAILFHDVVYDVKNKGNEERSRHYMINTCYSGFNHLTLQKAGDIILSTQHHTVHQDVDDETQIVLDLDLAGLGDTPQVYNINTNNVRKEWESTQYPSRDFIEGRKKFLRSMLSKPSIYYTDLFDEERACANIQNEYNNLNKFFSN